MTAANFGIALIMGLAGSLHCAGMCGPIIWVMPFQKFSGLKRLAGLLLYHAGRITVYCLLGLLLYSFKAVFRPELQQYLSLILGATLLLTGLISFVFSRTIKWPWTKALMDMLGKVLGKVGLGHLFIAGLLNGLLPCGLVYMALAMSTGAINEMEAMVVMAVFGLGTTPALVAISLLRLRVSGLLPGVRRIVPVFVFCFGCLFLLRGMNLGIPYLSPEVRMEKSQVRASCCHKS